MNFNLVKKKIKFVKSSPRKVCNNLTKDQAFISRPDSGPAFLTTFIELKDSCVIDISASESPRYI